MRLWLNVKDDAVYVGVGGDAVYLAWDRPDLLYARIGGRRSKPLKIDAWLERHSCVSRVTGCAETWS